ncbi:aspartate-ammonia ligase [Acrasis kona]|uniref:Aspartate-ammonia ligase n=1 Tax=Acrasis kona TaxID=1008807 RepID=A0AAW2YIX9_9EUKA
MSQATVTIPEGYKSPLSLLETEVAIKQVKDFFESNLSKNLNLTRISAPLFVKPETGLNDNLNGVESAVNFTAKDVGTSKLEIVHSLAKWKRMALHRYKFSSGSGLYADMNAIRKDEDLSNLHSIYVDQWDWERIIDREQRNKDFLKEIVQKLYSTFKDTETFVSEKVNSAIKPTLPEKIHFLTTKELELEFPDLDAKGREHAICKKHGAVFLMEIGHLLPKSGIKHDGRAPDYDDWELNGDILFWYPLLDRSIELSSMGIRVSAESLKSQLDIANANDRLELDYHKNIIDGTLPFTIGGGIGQSRICMFFLKKAHIGEVQSTLWDENTLKVCAEAGVDLL